MRQLIPTSLDEYIAEHKEGDLVTGRMTDVSAGRAKVELGEGVNATCRLTAEGVREEDKQAESKANLSSLTSMLEAKWKGGQGGGDGKAEPVRSGQIRSFRITRLDPAAKKIELELA
jgi:small subunit ribosomal protein S1